jgi:hypothetical protein
VSGLVRVVLVYQPSLKMAATLSYCTAVEEPAVIRFVCGQKALKHLRSTGF